MKRTVVSCDKCKKDISGKYYHIEFDEHESPVVHHDIRTPFHRDGIIVGKLPLRQEDVCLECYKESGECL